MLISLNVGLVLWVGYGFMIHSLPIILPNAVTFFLSAPLLVMKLRYQKSVKGAKTGRSPARDHPMPAKVRCLRAAFPVSLKGMEVHFTPETEKKLKDLAAEGGRGTADELVQDVVEGYFDELAQTREMLNSRYDDLKSGRVKPIPGDEVEAYFREKSSAARRSRQPSS